MAFTYANRRKQYGELIDCTPSRFLDELPPEDLQWEGLEEAPQEQKAARGNDALAAMRAMLKRGCGEGLQWVAPSTQPSPEGEGVSEVTPVSPHADQSPHPGLSGERAVRSHPRLRLSRSVPSPPGEG